MRLNRLGVHFKSIIERTIGRTGWASEHKENKKINNRLLRSKIKQELHIKKSEETD